MTEQYSIQYALYDMLPVAISVVDESGRLLYYNAAAAAAFDRKPEYIGRDIRDCHQKQGSIAKIDALLKQVRDNGHMPATYNGERKNKRYRIVINRLEVSGKLRGFVQCAIPLDAEGQA